MTIKIPVRVARGINKRDTDLKAVDELLKNWDVSNYEIAEVSRQPYGRGAYRYTYIFELKESEPGAFALSLIEKGIVNEKSYMAFAADLDF